MSAQPREYSILRKSDNELTMKYPAAILVLAVLAAPLGLLRAQAPAMDSRSVWDGVYTEEQARRLLAWGADALITDRPDVIVPLVAAFNRPHDA